MKSPENLTCKQLGLPIGLVLWTILFPSSVYTQDGACSCSTGCNFTQSCFPTDNCRKENVALGKPARISSSYSDIQGPASPACVAVNGNTGTTYVTVTQGGHPNCIHTALNDQNAWWEVDLGRFYTITDITVYIRESLPERMDNVKITVDDKNCYTFPTGTTSSPPVKNISCSAPLQGSIVRLSRNVGILNFCEVQVWVCKPGLYGEDCDFKCNCRNNEICDNYYGSCLQDRTCTSPCNQCNFTFVCDPPPPAFCKRENIALGRQGSMSSLYIPTSLEYTGFRGYITEAACLAFDGYRNTTYVGGLENITSSNCIHTMNFSEEWLQVDLGKIYTVRNITVYRRNQKIERLANILITVDNQQCYQFPENVTGFPVEIHIRCSSPLTGRIVKLSTHNQYLNLCEIEVWVCTSGLYGETCDGVCRCKNNAACDNYYGTCPTGCDAGYYGLNCSLQCGHCADMSQCNASGYCLSGCQNGWQGPRCDGCDAGYYGLNCSMQCGQCLAVSQCNVSGYCLTGCQNGWQGPMCNECISGSWGRQCQNTCGACLGSECVHDNGTCEKGCVPGYAGYNCEVLVQQKYDQDQTGVIVGSVLGAGVLISVCVIAVFIWFRRTSRNEKQPQVNKSKEIVMQAASCGNNEMQDFNIHEKMYEGFESQEEVSKPYTVHGEESHDSNIKHETAVDNNYDQIATQYQNTSDDWKPYEVLVSPPQSTNTLTP